MQIASVAHQERLIRSLERQQCKERPQPCGAASSAVTIESVSPTTGSSLIVPVSGLQARHVRSIEKFVSKESRDERKGPDKGEKMPSAEADRSAKEIRLEQERLTLNVHKELKELELKMERQRRLELQRRQAEMPSLGDGNLDDKVEEDNEEKERESKTSRMKLTIPQKLKPARSSRKPTSRR